MCDTARSRGLLKDAMIATLLKYLGSNLVDLSEVDFNPVRRKSCGFSVEEKSEGSGASLLKKEWSQVKRPDQGKTRSLS